MKRLILTTIILTILLQAGYSAWLTNVPQTVIQPDGQTINLLATGDEFHHWLHDEAGYTIVQDPTSSWFVYAQLINGDLAPTGYIVGQIDPVSTGLSPRINITPDQYREKRLAKFPVPQLKTGGLKSNIGTMNNIVIFIRFQYQSEFTETQTYYNNSFNGSNMVSMKTYFEEVSEDQIAINTGFYPAPSGDAVVSYQDSHPRQYYMPWSTSNPTGYQGDSQRTSREHTLLKNAVAYVSSQITATGLDFDMNNDGYVDNVCFIIQGATAGWSDLLWPHMWALYTENVYLGSARVWTYNFQLSNAFGVSVLCHEMFHSLGAPDLYRYQNDDIDPVGTWDLMNWNRNPPQHMTVHMKQKYGGWLSSIPTISTSGTYTLEPLSTNPFAAYKILSPNSSSEFFVVEYRKAEGQFESSLPGSGLIIYRVNPSLEGNADGPPDELYVYRPGGTSSVDGNLNQAFFSAGSGRTSFNDDTNPSCFLSNGADGGIKIQNITAAGTTISFDLVGTTAFNPPKNLTATVSGTTVGLTWQKPNTGSGTLTGYKIFRNGTLLQTISNPNTLNFNNTGLSAGIYIYHLTATYANPAGESGSSNQVSVTVGSQGSPDLTITNQSVSPTTVAPGDKVDIYCHLENNGETAAGESVLRLYLSADQSLSGSDLSFASGNMGELSPGYYIEVSGSDLTIPASLTPGTWYMLFVADAAGTVTESNEANNIASVQLQIGNPLHPPTNLKAQVAGNTVTLTWNLPETSSATRTGFKVYRNNTLLNTIQNAQTTEFVDQTVPAGTYSYYVLATYTNPTGNSDPSNTVDVTVSSTARPDFIILNPAVTPSTVDPGEEVDIACDYLNNGEAQAGASTLGIYVSQDQVWDDNDEMFAYGDFDALDAGYYYDVAGSGIALPASLTPGTWYVIFVADINAQVTESIETNNTAVVEITVQGSPLNPPRNLTGSVSGQSVTLAWSAPEQTTATRSGYKVFRNGAEIAQVSSGTTSYTDQGLNAGQYNYYVTAVYGNPAGQSQPSNTISVTIEAQSDPDLTITNATVEPQTVSPGGNISVSCRMTNIGAGTAGPSWLRLYLSSDNQLDGGDTEIANGQMSELEAGYYISVTGTDLSIPEGIQDGTWNLLFVADADQDVTESNETNNTAAVQLLIGSFDLNPPRNLKATIVTNDVTLTWKEPATTAATLSGYRVYRNNTRIASLGSASVSYTDNDLAYGTYTYNVTAVYSNPQGESDPSEELVITLSENSTPDLVITHALVNPSTVDPGTDIYIECRLANTGNGQAGASMIRLYLSRDQGYDANDVVLAYGGMDALAPGEYIEVSGEDIIIPNTLDPGAWFVLFVADADGEVTESDETNNVTAYAITIASQLPDLIIAQLSLNPVTSQPGGRMGVSTTVRNSGSGITPNCELHYYYSVDQKWDASDQLLGKTPIKRLFVSESAALNMYIQIPYNTGTGKRYIIVKADGLDQVSESNEVNNYRDTEFTVVSTGIDDYQLFTSLNIYPNPTSGEVNLHMQTKTPGEIQVEIINVLGQTILQKTIQAGLDHMLTLDTSSWVDGVYLVKLTTSAGRVFRSMVKN